MLCEYIHQKRLIEDIAECFNHSTTDALGWSILTINLEKFKEENDDGLKSRMEGFALTED